MIHSFVTLALAVTCDMVRDAYRGQQCCPPSSTTSIDPSALGPVCATQPGPMRLFADLAEPHSVDADAYLLDAFDVSTQQDADAMVYTNLQMIERFAAMYNKSVLTNTFVDTFYDRGTKKFTRSLLEVEHDLLRNLGNFYDIDGDLSGHLAVLFGASRGFGQGLAVALATMGADVIVTGRMPENWEMSVRMMSMSPADLQTHCVDAVASRTHTPLSQSDFTVSDGAPVPDLIWSTLTSYDDDGHPHYHLPQYCDPAYSGPLHVPAEVVARITYVKSDVRVRSQVLQVLRNVSKAPSFVANYALSNYINTSPLMTKEYNELTLSRNAGLNATLDTSILNDDDAIIAMTPNGTWTRVAGGVLYDSFHLTTVKASQDVFTAMTEVFGSGHTYTYSEGSSSTQLGIGSTPRSSRFNSMSLLNYMSSKKVGQQVLFNEMQYSGKNVVHTYTPVLKTFTGVSAFNYQFVTYVSDNINAGPGSVGWDKWVTYLRRKNDGSVVAFAPHNHQDVLKRVHHWNLALPTAPAEPMPGTAYYGPLVAKAVFDAHSQSRSITRLHPVVAMGFNEMNDNPFDYAMGLDSLVGTAHAQSMRNNSLTAIFNDKVWYAFNKAALFVSGGTRDVGIDGFKTEVVARKTTDANYHSV